MRHKAIFAGSLFCLSLAGAATAATVPFQVDAKSNSLSSSQLDRGKNTGVILSAGQRYSVSVDPDDLWSIGSNSLRHLGNADGAAAEHLYTFFRDSAFEATFSHGTLVGRVGDGVFFKVGTSPVVRLADASGTLNLYMWDINSHDNSGSLAVEIDTVVPVPLPATSGLVFLAIGAMAIFRRR